MKRVTLFCGHYGSGKTNLAVNYAFYLKNSGKDVVIADLDIVNPYFRTKDSEKELLEAGIEVISLPFANSSVDLPSLPSESYSIFQQRSKYAVVDIGGDDRGAYALGRFVPLIKEENDYDMFFVANFFRPLTRNAEEAYEVMGEIENACNLKFTGIINNSNLGEETTCENVISTKVFADRLSEISGLPVVMTSAEKSIAKDGMFPLDLQKKYF